MYSRHESASLLLLGGLSIAPQKKENDPSQSVHILAEPGIGYYTIKEVKNTKEKRLRLQAALYS